MNKYDFIRSVESLINATHETDKEITANYESGFITFGEAINQKGANSIFYLSNLDRLILECLKYEEVSRDYLAGFAASKCITI